MKRFDDALRELQEVSRLDPTNIKALYRKATVEEAQSNYEEALKTIESLAGMKRDEKDDKLFAGLKKTINKKVEEDKGKVKEMERKMVEGFREGAKSEEVVKVSEATKVEVAQVAPKVEANQATFTGISQAQALIQDQKIA